LSDFEQLQRALPRRYTLLRELDRGGTSRVYLAREELPDREVAIKVLGAALSAGLGRERFVREVETTSKLQHPHILPVHAAGDAGGQLYYVMPFVSGQSLRDRLDQETTLPVEEVLRIVQHVAGALAYAHDQGIVHRDVKPSSILFQSGHAVVAGFGIARAIRAAEGESDFTATGLPLGAPDYMSPEQAAGDRPVDGRTDTYSLACVAYEMLTGEPPFRASTVEATLARHRTDDMPSIRSVRGAVPEAVERVIAKALSKSPADRPSEVTDFAKELLTANAGALPTPPTAQRTPRRSLRIAGTVAVVLAVALGIQFWASRAVAGDRWEASVAIMPFENRTGDADFDNLGRSLADEVINLLTAVPEVRVIDPYTAVSLMNDSLGTPRLLDTLNVEHIIHGYIETRGDELVVNVSKSDLDGFLSLRTQHRVDPLNLGEGQVTLANTVALAFLRGVGLADRFDPGGSMIGPGRDAYLAGNSALGQRTPGAMREAVVWFQEAIRLEPTSAAALSALSSAYALSLYYKYDVGLPAYQLAARSLAAADSAIALDPSVANGYSARGYIRALLGIEIDEAEADFARAEELAPNAPNGPSWSARILAERGLIDEAFREARRARDLDPLQAGRRTALASLGFQLGNYDVAIDEAREASRLEPQLSLATAFEGRALALTGRGSECLRLDFGVYQTVAAICLHQQGRPDEARRLAAAAERRLLTDTQAAGDYLPELIAQDLAAYYGYSGDAMAAARWLTHAFELSPAGVDARILGSALFDPVRYDSIFEAAVTSARSDARARVRTERARPIPEL